MNPDEKLDAPVASSGGNARATLAQLNKRWGADELDPRKPPTLLLVKSMEHTETWRMVGRADGAKTMFELIETRRKVAT